MLTESKYFSKFIWAGAIFLLVATVIIPRVDFSLQKDSPRADATPDPFGEPINQMERLLRDGRLGDATAEEALRLAPALKARSLTAAGPMASSEIVWTVEKLEEYQPQIRAQPDEASEDALRNHRNELIFDALPRLDRQKGKESLDSVRQAYIDAIGVDPATTSKLPSPR